MRAVIISLAFFLVGLSSANCQIYDQPPTILGTVQNAFEQIVSVTDVGINDVNNQKNIFFNQFADLGTHVGVTGPVQSVVHIVYYWYGNLVVYADIVVAKVRSVISEILQSIHYQIVQLTHCSPYDLNQLINDNILGLERDVNAIRAASKIRLQKLMRAGSDQALYLHHLALRDCGAHVAELNKLMLALPSQVIATLDAEFAQRHAAIRNATLVFLNNLLTNIKQLLSTPPPQACLPPPIYPPVCPPPVIPPPPLCPPPVIPPPPVCSPPDVEPPPTC